MSFSRARVQRFNEAPTACSQRPASEQSKLPGRPKSSSGGDSSKTAKSLKTPTGQSTPTSDRNPLTANSEVFKDAIEAHEQDKMDEKSIAETEASKIDCSASNTGTASVSCIEGKKNNTSGIPLPKRPPSKSGHIKPGTGGCPRSASKISSRSSSFSNSPRVPSVGTHSLVLQFRNKKRRLELLKKDMISKQKPIMELQQALLDLKTKLQDEGVAAEVEDLGFLEGEEIKGKPKEVEEKEQSCATEEVEITPIDPESLNELKKLVGQIPSQMTNFVRQSLASRENLLLLLEKVASGQLALETAKATLVNYELESNELDNYLSTLSTSQEKEVDVAVEFIAHLLEQRGVSQVPTLNVASDGEIELVKMKLHAKEEELAETRKIVLKFQEELGKKTPLEEELSKSNKALAELKEKIKHLQTELDRERSTNAEHKNRSLAYDNKLKAMKNRTHELETKNKENEVKVNDLQKKLRNVQDNMRMKEVQWAKEKEEYVKNYKAQETLIQKMSSDRSHFETRLRAVDELLKESEKQNQVKLDKLTAENENARHECQNYKVALESAQKRCEFLEQEIAQLNTKKQVEMATFRKEHPTEFTSDREAELYTELLATGVALKDYEERIRTYEKEKLRFIDTIEKLNGNTDNNQKSLAETLVRQEEAITRYENMLKQGDAILAEKTMYVENLEAEVRNLRVRLESLAEENEKGPTHDLKRMIHESKVKLNEAMKKSLEHEQKIIQYEHDLDRQAKQINEMENLLKVRDGLIGMMKAKKDELLNENEGLKEYANELRNLLVEAKDDLRTRTEMIQELSMNYDNKAKMCHKLEKKIRELEATLEITNEKRFKLQDTIGTMEKELQNTKAQISQMADMHTRYANGVKPKTQLNSCKQSSYLYTLVSMSPPTDTNNNGDLFRSSIDDIDILGRRLQNLTYSANLHAATKTTTTTTTTTIPNQTIVHNHRHHHHHHHFSALANRRSFPTIDTLRTRRNRRSFTTLQEFIDHARNISEYESAITGLSRSSMGTRSLCDSSLSSTRSPSPPRTIKSFARNSDL